MGFYGVLKSSDEHTKFVFLTGLSKFYPVNFIFSEMNQIIDLTLDTRYADICGITQEELEVNFAPEIDGIVHDTGLERDKYMERLRRFYNGYRFSRKPLAVYNPFGLLNHFNKGGDFLLYSQVWFNTNGIKPDDLINFLSNEPPVKTGAIYRYPAACRGEVH